MIEGRIYSLEFVRNFEKWQQMKRPGLPGGHAGDLRLLGNEQDSGGKRRMSLRRALELMSTSKFKDWPHRGPGSVREFLESVLEASGDIEVYLGHFLRKSGASDNIACTHELKNLLGIVHLAYSYDQMDVSNLASIELAVRRILEIQAAVRRNPRHPQFDSFDSAVAGSTDEGGGARATTYNEWLIEQQKTEVKRLKATREWREEQQSDRRAREDRPDGKAKAKSKSKSKKNTEEEDP